MLDSQATKRNQSDRFDHGGCRVFRPAGRRAWCVLATLLGLAGCSARPPSPPEPTPEADAREVAPSDSECEALSEAEVARLSSGASLIEILRTRISGLQVSDATWQSGQASSMGLRGNNSFVGPHEPLVFVDGIRLPQPGGIEYVSSINPLDVAGIQILRGPATTALYGTGASSGVILICSKRGVGNASGSGNTGASHRR